jgi:hypothetical protein
MYNLGEFPTNSFVVKYKDPTTGSFNKAPVVQYTDSGVTKCGIRIGTTIYELAGYSTNLGNYYMAFPKNSTLFQKGTTSGTTMPMPPNGLYMNLATNGITGNSNHALNNLFLELLYRPTKDQFVFDDTLSSSSANYNSTYQVLSTGTTKTLISLSNGILSSLISYNPLGSFQVKQLNALRNTAQGPVYDTRTLNATSISSTVPYLPFAAQNLLFTGEHFSLPMLANPYYTSESVTSSTPESMTVNVKLVNSSSTPDAYTFASPASSVSFTNIYTLSGCPTTITNFSAVGYASLYGFAIRNLLGLIYVKFKK